MSKIKKVFRLKHNFPLRSFCYLAGCMFVFGLFGVLTGQDCNFDLQNYHFYNGYAFLFRPFGADIMPAGIHSFFIAWLDVPYYLVFRYGMNFPRLAAFLQASIYGIYAFVLMRICQYCLRSTHPGERYDWAFAWLVGLTGTMGISQIGMSSGEIYEAILLALALWAVLKGCVTKAEKYFLGAVGFAAVAFAFKYTAAPFCVAIGGMVLYFWKAYRQSYRWLVRYIVLGIFVIILLDGYFWYQYAQQFHNPLFPFFNGFFKSPYFDSVNLVDARFFPLGWEKWIFLPFYWVRETVEMGSEISFIDYRLGICFISVIVLILCALYDKIKKRPLDKCVTSLLIFAAVGYVIWLRLFVILRYLVILEGISAIFVVWALRKLPVVWKNCFLAGLLVLFSFTTVYPDWGTEPFAEKVLVFDDFQDVPDQSLILVQTQALSYVLPFFNQTATFVGGLQVVPEDYPPPLQRRAFLRNQLMPAFYHYHFERDVQHKIDTHQGPIYLLTYYWDHALYPTALARWGVKGDICQCHRFTTSWNKYFEDMILCPLEKI